MKRINLSLDDALFNQIAQDAAAANCSVNVHLINLLEKLYNTTPFNYAAALNTLEAEAKSQPVGVDFTLVNLPSFQNITVAQAQNAGLQPSIVRARLGRQFNARVKEGQVGNVRRALTKDGKPKFSHRAAVYCIPKE